MRSYATATVSMLVFVLGTLSSGCADPSQAPAALGEAPGPLVFEGSGSDLRVEAPAGEFNSFGIHANYSTESCGLAAHVYGVLGPSGVRIEDCPECVLPGSVRVGEDIPGFDLFACLPGSQECEITDDITGLTFDDLDYETYLCGEIVKPDSFTIWYQHLDTTEPEAPRTFITVTAELRIDANGNAEVIADWQRCVSNEDGETCDEPG
jgi:hypothetical protein